jgi:hypothetical protein
MLSLGHNRDWAIWMPASQMSPVPIVVGNRPMTEPIPSITLLPATNAIEEGAWLQSSLQQWLDREFIPEAINSTIARRAAQIYIRQRMEGENDLGSLVIAIVTEMQAFNFQESFFGEFTVANAVSDLILASLGIDNRCCGS